MNGLRPYASLFGWIEERKGGRLANRLWQMINKRNNCLLAWQHWPPKCCCWWVNSAVVIQPPTRSMMCLPITKQKLTLKCSFDTITGALRHGHRRNNWHLSYLWKLWSFVRRKDITYIRIQLFECRTFWKHCPHHTILQPCRTILQQLLTISTKIAAKNLHICKQWLLLSNLNNRLH